MGMYHGRLLRMRDMKCIVIFILGFFLFFAMTECSGPKSGSVYIAPTEDVSWYMSYGWKLIKTSAYPNSRIVMQCKGGECIGHWELIK
jgi:hypothetical protein